MGRVNIVKQIKVDGEWRLRSIPKKKSGHYDWTFCQTEITLLSGVRTVGAGVNPPATRPRKR
jgi:hypothetical protein